MLSLALLQGCESAAKLDDYLEKSISQKGDGSRIRSASRNSSNQNLKGGLQPDAVSDYGAPAMLAAEKRGTGEFVSDQPQYLPGKTSKGADGVTLNLVNVPVAQAAKTIFGDILKLNYTIDDKIAENVTLQTSTPMDRDALSDAFEDVLKLNGASVIKSGEAYRIIPASNANQFGREINANSNSHGTGSTIQVISLTHISANELKRIIDPVVPPGAILRSDTARNIIIVQGNKREIGNINALVQMFDVDWMKGMSVGFYPVKASDPEVLANELTTMMGLDKDGPLRGVVRILPNRRLGSVLVVSSKPHHLDTARKWIEKLEQTAEQSAPQLFVYKIQNRPTLEIAAVLQKVLGNGGSGKVDQQSSIAPKFEPETVSTTATAAPSPPIKNASGASQLITAQDHQTPANNAPDLLTESGLQPSANSNGAYGTSTFGNIKVTPDESKHALLIEALPRDYDRVLRILERIDFISTQVMLEAVIAEVSLNDELKFGVKWYFENHQNRFVFSNAASGAVASAFPGFSYFFSASSMKMALDALSGVTDVKVVSAPSLMVMDNRKAVLQIGDQVPIITQSAQSVLNPDSPIVNSVTMKDTGIILAVTPRVNDSGSVVLEVEQEVSNVAKTTSSGIDSPTIQQRRVKTTVVVGDGEVMALGGLIQQRDEVNKTQVPILGNLPVVGSAFRSKDDTTKRTELVIFIRPQVARDESEARRITEEYRSRINMSPMMETKGHDHYRRDANRILR